MKKLLFGLLLSIAILGASAGTVSVFAQGTQLEIIPQVDVEQVGSAHDEIIDGESGRHVRDIYDEKSKELGTKEQIVSGIMTRDTLLNYGVILLQFLSQAGIAIGGLMFIYTGYKYIMSIITGGGEPSKDLITNAIIGILVIIFSYAIMRLLTRTFLV